MILVASQSAYSAGRCSIPCPRNRVNSIQCADVQRRRKTFEGRHYRKYTPWLQCGRRSKTSEDRACVRYRNYRRKSTSFTRALFSSCSALSLSENPFICQALPGQSPSNFGLSREARGGGHPEARAEERAGRSRAKDFNLPLSRTWSTNAWVVLRGYARKTDY